MKDSGSHFEGYLMKKSHHTYLTNSIYRINIEFYVIAIR